MKYEYAIMREYKRSTTADEIGQFEAVLVVQTKCIQTSITLNSVESLTSF